MRTTFLAVFAAFFFGSKIFGATNSISIPSSVDQNDKILVVSLSGVGVYLDDLLNKVKNSPGAPPPSVIKAIEDALKITTSLKTDCIYQIANEFVPNTPDNLNDDTIVSITGYPWLEIGDIISDANIQFHAPICQMVEKTMTVPVQLFIWTPFGMVPWKTVDKTVKTWTPSCDFSGTVTINQAVFTDSYWGPEPTGFANDINSVLSRMSPSRKLILIGKSIGACKLIKVSNALKNLNVPVDMLILVDPSGFVANHSGETPTPIPTNVKRVYNLRQTSPSAYSNGQNGFPVSFAYPTMGYDIDVSQPSTAIAPPNTPGKILCPPNPTPVGHDNIDERAEILEFVRTAVKGEIASTKSMYGAAGWINLKNDKWHNWFSPLWEKSAVGDFDGNKIDDIATVNSSGTAYVCYSNTTRFGSGGSSSEPVWFSDPNFKSSYDILAGDFNGDKQDELISFRKDNGYYYIKGNAYTNSGLTVWKSSKNTQTVYLAVTDLDNNGYEELVGTYLIPSPRSVHMTILYESGPLNKVTHMGNDFPYDQYFGPIAFGDVTRDGIKDLISLVPDGYSNYAISWAQLYQGAKDAAGNVRFTFIQRCKGPAIDAGSQVVASDFDNDGVCDVIMSGSQQTNGFRTIRAFQGLEVSQPWEIPGLVESLPNPKDYSLPDAADGYPTTINAGRFAHKDYNDLIYFNKGYEADAFVFQVRDANDIKSIAR